MMKNKQTNLNNNKKKLKKRRIKKVFVLKQFKEKS